MHSFVEGILAYSRVGRDDERLEKIALDSLVREIIDILAPPEHIQVNLDVLPEVIGNPIRFQQVFQNLLSNAIRFQDKPEGWVNVSSLEFENHWQFCVADNGPGIAEKYHTKVFKIFQTLSPRDEFESTGIGLAIVKKGIDNWGGRIWIESTVGEGSAFYFTLPKGRHREDG
jgi:signal transduction histidine kinase